MQMQEYPKALYLRGWDDLDASVTVRDAAEEAAARAQGYRMLSEPAPVDADGDGTESAAELRAALDAKGVAYDRRWGVARLRAALDAAA
jgi:hypothetical protein